MRRYIPVAVMSFALVGLTDSRAQGISDAKCAMWESVMLGQTIGFREQEIPIDIAKKSYGTEESIDTRLFLYGVVERVYRDPENAKQYIKSGGFKRDCVRIHRGF